MIKNYQSHQQLLSYIDLALYIPLTYLMVNSASPNSCKYFIPNSLIFLKPCNKASYSTMLFVQGNPNLYGMPIKEPLAYYSKTLAP